MTRLKLYKGLNLGDDLSDKLVSIGNQINLFPCIKINHIKIRFQSNFSSDLGHPIHLVTMNLLARVVIVCNSAINVRINFK